MDFKSREGLQEYREYVTYHKKWRNIRIDYKISQNITKDFKSLRNKNFEKNNTSY